MQDSIISPITRPANAPPLSTPANSRPTWKDTGLSKDEVAKKAYSIYLDRGSPQGLDQQHWFEAEAQVKAARQLSRQQVPPRM